MLISRSRMSCCVAAKCPSRRETAATPDRAILTHLSIARYTIMAHHSHTHTHTQTDMCAFLHAPIHLTLSSQIIFCDIPIMRSHWDSGVIPNILAVNWGNCREKSVRMDWWNVSKTRPEIIVKPNRATEKGNDIRGA